MDPRCYLSGWVPLLFIVVQLWLVMSQADDPLMRYDAHIITHDLNSDQFVIYF